ncbi:MAG: DUF4136 domain-containing protein [Sphingorhabdus sp.]
MSNQIMRKAVMITAPIALLTLTACATPFRADVSRFQQLPPAQGQSFNVQAANPENSGGLEFAQYASLVSDRMQTLGYVPAAKGTPTTKVTAPDLTVTLDYGVDEGKQRSVERADPFYDPYWGFGRRYGYFGRYSRPRLIRTRRGYRYVSGWHDPFLFGGYGFRGGYGVRSFTVFTSDLDLKIKRNSDGQSLFEGRAEAKSRSNKLTYLVPNLVEAMFTGFPGSSGETVRISVAPEKK